MRFTGTVAEVANRRGIFAHGETIGVIIIGIIISVIAAASDFPSIRPDYSFFNPSTGTVDVNYSTAQKPTFVVSTDKLGDTTKSLKSAQKLTSSTGSITTKVTTANGQPANVKTDINPDVNNPGQYTVALSPDSQPAPGRYKIEVQITKDGHTQTVTQDFTWGVLALNLDQSTYIPTENARIGMAVLDDQGVTQCDAKTKLEITRPDKTVMTLSSDSHQITTSDTCKDKSVTNKPDYLANYTPDQLGDYTVEFTAITKNGTRTMRTTFTSTDQAAFVTERHNTAMRLYPAASYDVDLLLHAHQAVTGSLQEQVPQSFVITNPKLVVHKSSGASVVIGNNRLRVDVEGVNRTMTWGGVTLQKGDVAEITYTYQPPYVSPAFYQLGPMKVQDKQAKSVFEEPRAWQLASDAVNEVTLLWDTANGAIPAGWTCTSCTAGDPFYQLFPLGNSTYAGTGGGPESVTHTYAQTAVSAPSAVTGNTSTVLASRAIPTATHTHTFGAPTIGSTDIKPKYQNLEFIKASNPLGLPQNAIAMFDVASTASLPTNWSSYTPLNDPGATGLPGNGVYLRGEGTNTTGGAATHTHTVSSVTSGGPSATVNVAANNNITVSSATHTHTFNATTSPVDNNAPSYISVVFAKLSVDNDAVPNGMMAFFDTTTMPTGWTQQTTIGGTNALANRLIKGSLTAGTIGGATTHNHSGSQVITTLGPSATAQSGNAGLSNTTTGTSTHTHNVTYSISAGNSMPNYRSVIIAKFATVNITGTVYSDEGVTTLGSQVVKASINGGAQRSTTAAANGTFTLPMPDPGAGGVFTLWLNTGGGAMGATVDRSNGGAISGVDIYQNRLVVSHEDAGPTSNSNVGGCDKTSGVVCTDSDLHYDVSGSNLTVDNDWRLFVKGGKTFTPGGNVTLSPGGTAASVGGDLKWGSATSTVNIGANALNVGGDWINTAGGTFTKSSGQTTTMTGTVTGLTVDASTKNFEKLTFNGSGGAWAFTPAATAVNVDNDFAVTTGTVTAPSGTLSVGGSWTNAATFTHNSGTVAFTSTATGKTINQGSSNFNNVMFNGSGGGWSPITNTLTVLGDLTMTAGTLGSAADTSDITVNGNATGTAGVINVTNSGRTFTQRVATGKSFGSTTAGANWTFNNLTFSNSNGSATPVTITTNTGTGTVTVGEILKVGATGDATGATTTLDAGVLRIWTLSGTGGNPFQLLASPAAGFTANTSAFFYTGDNASGNTTVQATAYYKLVIQNNAETFVPSGSFAATFRINVNNGIFDLGANNVTIGSAGVTNSGFLNVLVTGTYTQSSPGTTTIVSSSGATAVQVGGVGSTTFYNLSFLPAVASAPTFQFGTLSGQTVTVSNNLTIGDGTNPVIVDALTNNETLDVNGNVTINATATLSASASSPFTIAGNYTNSGTFTHNSGTVTFDAGATGKTINPGASSFYNLTFNGAGGGWTIQTNPATITNDLLSINGTLGATQNITVNGSVQCSVTCGTINVGNTFTQSVATSKNFGTNVAVGTNWTFNNLIFDASSGTPTITVNGTGTGTTVVSGTLALTKSGTSLSVNDATNNRIIDANGDVTIASGTTLVAPGSASFTVAGSWTNNGTFTHSSGTVTFDSSSTGKTINSGSSSFNNLIFNGSGAWSALTNTLTVVNDLTMTAGTLDNATGSANIVVNGNVQGTAGVINLTTNTFTQRVAADKNFGATTGATGWTFNNLTFSNSNGVSHTITTQTGGTGTVTINGILLVSNTGDTFPTVLNAGNRTWKLVNTNGAAPFNMDLASGSLTPASSTFEYTGNNGAGDVTVEDANYNNLTFGGGSAENYNPEGTLNIAGNLLVNANGTLIGTQNITVNGHANGAGKITLTGGVFINRVAAAQDFGSNGGTNDWTFNDLRFEDSAGSNATVTINPTGSGKIITTGTLTVGNAGDSNTTTLDDETNDRIINANGDFTITSKGTYLASSTATFNISGSYLNNGTFTAGAGTVTFNSLVTGKTLAGSMTGANKFNILTFNGSGGAWSFAGNSAEVAGNFTITAGTVTAPSSTLTLTSSYSNSGTFTNNSGTVLFNATTTGKTLAGAMTAGNKFYNLTFNGSGGAWSFAGNSADVANDFIITAGTVTAPSSTLTLSNNYSNGGTFTHNSGAVVFNATSTGKTINTGGSAFNNVSFNGSGGGWTIQTNAATINGDLLVIAGTVGSSVNITANGNVQCSVTCGTINVGNTFTQSVAASKSFGTNVASATDWTFNNLIFDASSGTPTITFNGTGTGQTIVTGNLSLTKSGTSLTVNDATSNRIFTVSGDVAIAVSTTLQAPASASFTVGGSWANAGTFTHSSGTVTFNSGSTGKTIDAGSSAFYNVTFNGAGGGWSPRNNTLSITNDLTMTAGTLGAAGDTADIIVNGNASGTAGVINITASGRTFRQRVLAGKNFGPTTASTNWAFVNLAFSNGNAGATPVTVTTTSGTGTMAITGVLTIGTAGDATGATTTLDAGNRSWTLSGTGGNPFQILASPAGSLNGNTSTFTYTGNNGSGNTTVQGASYYKLVINNGGETFDENGATSASSDLTITAGTFALGTNSLGVGSSSVTNSGSINVATGATLSQTGGTTSIQSSSAGTATIGGAGTLTFNNLTFNPSVASAPTFTLGSAAGQTITVNGILTVGNGTNGAIVTAVANDPIIDSNSDVTINASGTFVASDTATFTVAGSWTNAGTFTHSNGTVTLDAPATGKTINAGGTGAGKDFNKVIFNNTGGGWTIQTGNMRAVSDLTITNLTILTLQSGRTLEIDGSYIPCDSCTSKTNWTGSTLFLNSGTNYTVGSKTQNAVVYGTLQVGANTDIRTWNSSASTDTVNASGSLYSQNDTNVPGSLAIYGDYHVIGTDYWMYDTDFDGAALSGINKRQAVVRIETGSGRGVTIDSAKTLTIKGGGTGASQFTDINRIGGSGQYHLVNSGTSVAQEAKLANASFDGGTWAPINTVVTGQSVTAGTLTTDWYVGGHVVDRDTPATNIDTTGSDITVSETSGSPASTVFKMASGSWGSGATSQTADSASDGRTVNPNTDGALRIREYSQTSGGTTYYQYNVTVAPQTAYANYDYQRDYGKYMTSTGNTGSPQDQVIGSGWYRDTIATENTLGTLNSSVTTGTWYGGMSISILSLWDTSDGAIPSGWSCVSCSGGDPFYQRFLRGAASYGGTGGGPETHGHNLSSPNATAGASFGATSGGISVAGSGHTHTWDFGAGDDTSTADNKPPYKNLQVIRGPNSGPKAWPANVIMPYRTATPPASWTAYTALDNNYVRGENTNTTGGSATHSHTSNTLVSSTASGTGSIACVSGCSTAAASAHTHNLAATALATDNNNPLHVNVRFMKHSDTSLPPSRTMLGLFDHTTFPTDYVQVSGSGPYVNNLLVGATSNIEATGGSATHNHGGSVMVTSGAPIQAATNTAVGAGVNVATASHTHNVTYTVDAASSMPNYRDVVIAKFNPNVAPDVATAMAQKKTDDTVIASGGWINQTSVKFTATVSSDNILTQQLQLCVEKKAIGVSFTNTEDSCGTAVSETSGTSVPANVTIAGISAGEYHWQARVKNQFGDYSPWIDYDTPVISTRDFGIDTTAPTTAAIYDNTNLDTQPFTTDTDQNANGSLTTLSATWSAFDTTIAGLSSYDYSIGTTPGGTDIKAWTTNGTTTYIRDSSLTLQTNKTYYINVRATDNAGNVSSVASSNGQHVTPTLTFDIDVSATDTDTGPPYIVDFGGLSATQIADSPQKIWVDFETNGVAGGKVYVAGLSSGLHSAATGYTINSASSDLASANTGFGAQDTSVAQGSGGPFLKSSPYDGASQNVGAINTSFQSIFTSANPITSGRGSFILKVKPSDLTPASNDYNDTLIVIAAGTY